MHVMCLIILGLFDFHKIPNATKGVSFFKLEIHYGQIWIH